MQCAHDWPDGSSLHVHVRAGTGLYIQQNFADFTSVGITVVNSSADHNSQGVATVGSFLVSLCGETSHNGACACGVTLWMQEASLCTSLHSLLHQLVPRSFFVAAA